MTDESLTIDCEPTDGGYACSVRVGADAAATRHQVTVGTDDLSRLAPMGTTADELVRISFEFLLEREPRDSILRAFDLAVISSYFPEYESELRRRLSATADPTRSNS